MISDNSDEKRRWWTSYKRCYHAVWDEVARSWSYVVYFVCSKDATVRIIRPTHPKMIRGAFSRLSNSSRFVSTQNPFLPMSYNHPVFTLRWKSEALV